MTETMKMDRKLVLLASFGELLEFEIHLSY